jgi:hypothetical protein
VAAALLVLQGYAPAQPPAAGDKPVDLAPYLDLARHSVPPVTPQKDVKTGFVVGGRNDTALILKLTEINGRTIAELEKDMRPMAKSAVGSSSGFLGKEEKLLDVLAADNRTVVEEMGLTHQELARHLHAIGTIGRWLEATKKEDAEFVYNGRRFKVKLMHSRGSQPSPFNDDTESGSNATVFNLDSGKNLKYGLLVPYMVERYGFYEGKGTPYRLDPVRVVEVLDFIKAKKKDAAPPAGK